MCYFGFCLDWFVVFFLSVFVGDDIYNYVGWIFWVKVNILRKLWGNYDVFLMLLLWEKSDEVINVCNLRIVES